MAEAGEAKRAPRQLSELPDVYGLLEEVRLRPSMWVRDRSLQHLNSMLTGYRVALGIYAIDEPYDFWNPGSQGPFTEWLWTQPDMPNSSALGWATEIERAAERANRPALDVFFDLLDQFRAQAHEARPQAKPTHQAPEQPHATD
ncbi:hypothetical protein ACWGDT_28545 [Streptomyces avermitilis]